MKESGEDYLKRGIYSVKKQSAQFFYYFGLIMQLGTAFAVSIFISLFLGSFLDKKLHTKPIFIIIFLIFGIITGFISSYKLVKEGGLLEENAGSKKHLA